MKRLTALSLAFTLWFAPLTRAVHAQSESGDVDKTAKVKAEIAKRVTSKKTRVKIKLRNGGELKGRIDRADENGVTIAEDKTGKKVELAYGEIEKVNGRGLGKGAKIGMVAAIAVGVLAIVVVIALKNFDPFKGGLGHVPP